MASLVTKSAVARKAVGVAVAAVALAGASDAASDQSESRHATPPNDDTVITEKHANPAAPEQEAVQMMKDEFKRSSRSRSKSPSESAIFDAEQHEWIVPKESDVLADPTAMDDFVMAHIADGVMDLAENVLKNNPEVKKTIDAEAHKQLAKLGGATSGTNLLPSPAESAAHPSPVASAYGSLASSFSVLDRPSSECPSPTFSMIQAVELENENAALRRENSELRARLEGQEGGVVAAAGEEEEKATTSPASPAISPFVPSREAMFPEPLSKVRIRLLPTMAAEDNTGGVPKPRVRVSIAPYVNADAPTAAAPSDGGERRRALPTFEPSHALVVGVGIIVAVLAGVIVKNPMAAGKMAKTCAAAVTALISRVDKAELLAVAAQYKMGKF